MHFLSRVDESHLPPPDALPPSPRRSRVDRVSGAVGAMAFAAATLLGMLIGLGRRHGTTWQPLNASARILRGEHADGVFGFQADVTLSGVAVVLVMSAVAACVTAGLTSSRKSFHRAMTAAGVALVGYLVHLHIVARTPGGLAALLDVGELRALYVTLAIALFIGMRYAFFDGAGALPND